MMYAKLIFRNIKRSTKEYAIYMMTLTLAVTLMYAFNGVAFSKEVNELAMNMGAFAGVTIAASVLIVLVLAWLVYYISKFILEKRSREFGMYMLMGMTRKQVSRMFLLEQISMGLLAYIIGCGFGIVVYEVMQAIILNMFHQGFAFRIEFSFTSAWLTLLYFVMMYVIELFRERHYLKKKRIHELLFSDKKNDKHKHNKKISILYFVFAMILYVVGLKMLEKLIDNSMTGGFDFLLTILCIVVSIIFVFLGLSHVITLLFNHKKKIKYTGNTLYLSSQICSRLKTSRTVLALLSLLTLSSFLLIGIGLKFNQAQKDSEKMVPFDIQAVQYYDDLPLDVSLIKSYLAKHAISYEDYTYRRYQMDYDATSVVKGIKWAEQHKKSSDFTYIAYSDYANLMKLLDYKPKQLKKDQYLICTATDFDENIAKNSKEYTFEGLSYGGSDTRDFGESRYNAIVFVVPDKILDTMDVPSKQSYVVKSKTPSTLQWYNDIPDDFYDKNKKVMKDEENSTWDANNLITIKAEWIAANLTSTLIFVFTFIYIAIILSCVSATVLAIQQMSDVWKQKKSYAMLWKMGVHKSEIHKILRKQIAIYFFVPFIVPVLYVFPITYVLDGLFAHSYSRDSIIPLIFFAILLYLVIYIIYYLLAYFNCKRSIKDVI